MPRRQHEDTRQGILMAAQRLMARKGYTAVGINEIVTEAGVPKGSFYHYFASKDSFGEAVMIQYFDNYLADMDRISGRPDTTAAKRLMEYWQYWYDIETGDEYVSKCLAVKLGAEVADLSEPMRRALHDGTSAIIVRIAGMIRAALSDESLTLAGDPLENARLLYDLWLGASVRAKIDQDAAPLDNAMARTLQLLGA